MQVKNICCDVAVIGGGVSGVVAALAAARRGTCVYLVEYEEFLGGIGVSGLGILSYKDRAWDTVIGGIAQELIDRLERFHGSLGHNPCPILNSLTPVNASLLRLILFEMCQESGVKLLLGCSPVGVDMEDDHLRRVKVYGKGEWIEIKASIFIDATGDGDLCEMTGMPYEKGDKDGELQPPTLVFAVSGVEKEKLLQYVEENPSEVDTPDGYEMKVDVEFFRTVRGYNMLGLDTLVQKARDAGDYVDVPRDSLSMITHPNEDTVIFNNTRLINFDGTDFWQVSQGTCEAYRQVEELIKFIPKYIPGYEHATLSFVAPSIGVRETRRFVGQRCLAEANMRAGEIPADTVALCGYNVDIHHGQDNGSDLYIVQHGYGIPYGCMVPKRTKGVIFTGRTIWVDRVVFASTRVMSTCMALGEAAGAAAAMCVHKHCDPDDVPVDELRQSLIDYGAVLSISSAT